MRLLNFPRAYREGEFSLLNQLVSGVLERCGSYLMYGNIYGIDSKARIQNQKKTKASIMGNVLPPNNSVVHKSQVQ